MDRLSECPRDALIGCGNSGIVAIDVFPSYYDGAHQVPEFSDKQGYHIRTYRAGAKVLLSAPSVQEIIENRFPLYTPIIVDKFHPTTNALVACDQGLDAASHYAIHFNAYVISCLKHHYPEAITTWAQFWAAVCKAYRINPQSQHEVLQLHQIEQNHCNQWNATPAIDTPHITYAQLGAIAAELIPLFPAAKTAAGDARYDP